MNRFPNLFGPAARHPDLGHRGTTSVEWATLAIVIVILVIVALLLVDALVRRRRHRLFWSEHAGHRPLVILRMRYARGEIGHDEYVRALAALGGPQEQAATEPGQEAQNPEGKETQPRIRRGRS